MADLGLGVAGTTSSVCGIEQLRARRADIAAQLDGINTQMTDLRQSRDARAAALAELDFALGVLEEASAGSASAAAPDASRRNIRAEVLAAITAAGPSGISTNGLINGLGVRQKAVDAATSYHRSKERIYYASAFAAWCSIDHRSATAPLANAADG